MLFADWEVRIAKSYDRGLENATLGRRPSGVTVFTRKLKQITTTTTATRTSLNKRLNEQNVRYISWYISLPSSAKQQREMTKFCGVYKTWTTPANFSYFHLELNAFVAYVSVERF